MSPLASFLKCPCAGERMVCPRSPARPEVGRRSELSTSQTVNRSSLKARTALTFPFTYTLPFAFL